MLALGWSVQSGTVPSELSFREVVARAPGEPTTITKRGTSGLDYFTPPSRRTCGISGLLLVVDSHAVLRAHRGRE